jgi:hypothetical protein
MGLKVENLYQTEGINMGGISSGWYKIENGSLLFRFDLPFFRLSVCRSLPQVASFLNLTMIRFFVALAGIAIRDLLLPFCSLLRVMFLVRNTLFVTSLQSFLLSLSRLSFSCRDLKTSLDL